MSIEETQNGCIKRATSDATASSSSVGGDQDQPSVMTQMDSTLKLSEVGNPDKMRRQLGCVRHNDFLPSKQGTNERSVTLSTLTQHTSNVNWIHLYRDESAVVESLEMLYGCQNDLLESSFPHTAIIVITVVTSHATKRGTRAVLGLIRGGNTPQMLARGLFVFSSDDFKSIRSNEPTESTFSHIFHLFHIFHIFPHFIRIFNIFHIFVCFFTFFIFHIFT